jgi:hypothetical protein
LSLIHNLTNQTSYKEDCFICAPLQILFWHHFSYQT